MNKKTILVQQIIGASLAIIFGSLLHFVFDWTGGWKPIALIAAVNESTWEHLKLAFWPVFLFGIWEYFFFGKKIVNFFFAKAASLITIPVTIIVLFYGYTLFIEDKFFLDIAIFILAIILGYYLSLKILIAKNFPKLKIFSILAILILLHFFSAFYFCPASLFSLSGSSYQ